MVTVAHRKQYMILFLKMNNITKSKKRPRIWTISELYYPEETSTGHFMTKITEVLSARFNTFAICSQPTYSSRGIKAPRNESHNGVDIIRVFSTTFNKNNTILRLINILSFSFSTFITCILKIRKNDTVFVVTNPPFLPFIAMIICKIKGANYVLRIDDVYPDILVAAKKLNKESYINNIFNYFNKILFKNALAIIALGNDMKDLLIQKEKTIINKIKVITNWGQTDIINPNASLGCKFLSELKLTDKFVLLWAGNMGIPHGIEDIFNAAYLLNGNENIHFLFIGSGVKKNWLMVQVNSNKLTNCTFLDPLPRSDQEKFLNACDIVLSSLIPGMEGVSVPSRMYNIFSAGKPILGIGDNSAELARVINDYKLGFNISPHDTNGLVNVILKAASNKEELIEMGNRARKVAENQFSQKHVLEEYLHFFTGLVYK